MTTHLSFRNSLKIIAFTVLMGAFSTFTKAQVCNAAGNLMIFSNYDGGTLTINVDQNIPNLKIGICSYEGCAVYLTGAFVGNVTAVRYAGYNGSNNHCSGSINTSINGAPGTATTSIAIMPAVTLSNPNGYGSMICGYSCSNNTNQGGCNTVDQIEAYFLSYWPGSVLFAHKVQYGCWTGTHSLSIGGTCCPPIPVVPGSVSASQTICAGQVPAPFASQAVATGGSGTITYTWQSSTTSTNSGFTNISGASATGYTPGIVSTTTYYRRAASTATNNVSYSNVITVTALPLPVVSISGQTAVCAGSTTTLTASGGTSYAWSPGNQTGQSITMSPTTGIVITITCFPVNGCSVTANITLTMVPLPTISIPVIVPICEGESLNILPSGALTYTLMPNNISGSSFTVSPSANTTYTVLGTTFGGCSNSTLVPVTVMPLPTVTAVSSATIVCTGESATLTGMGAVSYTWLPGNINFNSIIVTPLGISIYTVTGSDANGCTDVDIIAISTAPLPTVVITPTTSTICSGKTTTFSASGALNYTWMPGNVIGANVTLNPSTNTNFTVTGSAGCSNTVIVPVAVDPSPTISVAASRSVICKGQSSTLTPQGALSYTWTNVVTPTTGVAVVNPTTSTGYSVTGIGSNGCDNQAIYTLTVSNCTGIDAWKDVSDKTLVIFPNPNSGEFILKGKTSSIVKLFDSQGKLVNSYELNPRNNYEAMVTNLSAGIYFVVTDGATERQKIIVTK